MQLFKFQERGVDFLASKKYALLADEQGTGKTIMAIAAAKRLKLKAMLIICPASVKYNWQRELSVWYPSIHSFVVEGTRCMIPVTDAIIVNYDLIYRGGILTQLLKQCYDVVICDESHMLKTPGAKRTKAVLNTKGIADRTDKVWLMTGTPVLNRPVELFSMMRKFVPERLGKFKDYISYTKRYCGAYQSKFGWDARGATNIPELAELLKGFMLRRLKKDVLQDLPDKIFQKIELATVSKEAKKAAKEEKNHYNDTQENLLGALATTRRIVGLEKLPQSIAHIKNLMEEKDKLVVFGHHREVLEALREALSDYNPVLLYGGLTSKQKQACVDKFVGDTDCKLFIGQIDSAGVGIDGLQKVCDTVVFAEISWVPGKWNQAIDRLHRIGQKGKVLIQFLLMKDSIDEQILDSVLAKSKVISEIMKDDKKEKKMIEENLRSIAKSLERIADALDVQNTVTLNTVETVETVEKPKKKAPVKKKAAKKVEVAGGFKTATELLTYCNGIILPMKDKAKAQLVVKEVVGKIQEELGCSSLSALPDDVEALCKAKEIFDGVVSGA